MEIHRPRGLSRSRGITACREGAVAVHVAPARYVGTSILVKARRQEKRSMSIVSGASREQHWPQRQSYACLRRASGLGAYRWGSISISISNPIDRSGIGQASMPLDTESHRHRCPLMAPKSKIGPRAKATDGRRERELSTAIGRDGSRQLPITIGTCCDGSP